MASVSTEARFIAGRVTRMPKVFSAHLDNVKSLLDEALTLAKVIRLEVHGNEDELAKLREPLAAFNPAFFVLKYGIRREWDAVGLLILKTAGVEAGDA